MADEMQLLLDASAVLSALYVTGEPLPPARLATEAGIPRERLSEALLCLEAAGRVLLEPATPGEAYSWAKVALP